MLPPCLPLWRKLLDKDTPLPESFRRLAGEREVRNLSTARRAYPDWKAIIPGSAIEQQLSDSFNFSILSSFGQLIIAAYGNSLEHKAIRLLQNGQNGALVLHNTNDWFGMIMPMRINIDRVSIPFFIDATKPDRGQVAAE